jgi:hypothetical protein
LFDVFFEKGIFMIKFSFEFAAGVLQFEITLLTGTEAPIPNSIGIEN